MKSNTTPCNHLPEILPGLLTLQQDLATRLSRSQLFPYPSSAETGTLRKQNDDLKKQLSLLTVQMETLGLTVKRENEDFPCPT